MNDLPNISNRLKFFLFAYDTSIHFDSNNIPTLQTVVNRKLRKVRKWLEANRLTLNVRKTNYVIFHSPANKINEFIKTKLGSKPNISS